jgi:AmmeMemoRadiSam system protein A
MHPFAELAKKAVEEYVRNRRTLTRPPDIATDFKRRAGVFICLKKHGELRGCIGTFHPCREGLFEEIVFNAIAASTEDPRFPLVQPAELGELKYTVDVLSEPEKISDQSLLNPEKYGIIVAKGHKRGLLLPDLEGVDTVEEQIRITKIKAGIRPEEKEIEIFRFTVDRYH